MMGPTVSRSVTLWGTTTPIMTGAITGNTLISCHRQDDEEEEKQQQQEEEES